MSTGDAELLNRVRQRLAQGGSTDLGTALRSDCGLVGDAAALSRIEGELRAELSGAGPLESLLGLPGICDVLVNGADQVWFDRGRGLERSEVGFADDAAIRRLGQRLAASAGRRLDDASPFVDVQLADGTRLHAALPPVVERPTLSLRVLARTRFELADLVRAGAMPHVVAALIEAAVRARLAILISGGTGTGKTTLLGALLGCLPPAERVLLVEDVAEVVTRHPHLVRLVGRNANIEGRGAIGLPELVREALRMRPDRIVVGEFRGAEVLDLLSALNTGHEGGAATLHANALADVPSRFTALAAMGGAPPALVDAQLASAFDLVVQLRYRSGMRQLSEVGVLCRDGNAPVRVLPIWTSRGPLVGGESAARAELARRFADRGVDLPSLPP